MPDNDDGDVDLEQHERVAKALEQINGLRYRAFVPPWQIVAVLLTDLRFGSCVCRIQLVAKGGKADAELRLGGRRL